MDQWLAIGRNSIYTPDSFEYRFNELGFRCDTMVDPQSHAHRAIWVGCSVTEGIGLPMEATWGYLLTDRLRKRLPDENMPYWCVARGGTSQDYLARQLTMMIPRLRPRTMVMTLPDASRREIWDNGRLDNWTINNHLTRHLDRRVLEVWDDDQIMHDSRRAMLLIHMTCMAYGVAYWWRFNCVDNAYDGYPLAMRIADGLPDDIRCRMLNRSHFSDRGDLARDGNHPGPLQHEDYAEGIWQEIGEDLLANMC